VPGAVANGVSSRLLDRVVVPSSRPAWLRYRAMDDALFRAGIEARSRVLGPEFVTKAFSTADSFNREFQEMVTEYCWGGVWSRSSLTDKQRSLNNLCILAALNRSHEFQLHVRGALRNGCTLDELRDTLIQVTVYAGVPAGVEAFRLAREVLDAEGIVPEPTDRAMPDIPAG
jgi:4-carboxymuconolactone decarboxylase